jgi:hypothetical protein
MTTRSFLIQWCKRSLGHPVVEINVADEQLEDRIDEALTYWTLHHYEGVERLFLTHKITASELHITGTNAASFSQGAKITGATSGASATVTPNKENNVILIRDTEGTFAANEIVSDGVNTATLTATNFYVAGDVDNGWIPIPDSIYGVVRVLPLFQNSSSQNIFDIQYQLMLNDMKALTSTDLTYYVQAMSHLTLLQQTLGPVPDFDFNRMQGRLRLDVNWKTRINPDQHIAVEAYRAVDPTQFVKVWSEPWLRLYATALIKRQWGINLKKFSGLQLPGGVTLDGDKIYQEAMIEIRQLEEELTINSAPLNFYMG